MGSLFAACAEIEELVYDLAGKIDGNELTRETALSQLMSRYPGLTEETAKLTLRHGTYYWWRDHG